MDNEKVLRQLYFEKLIDATEISDKEYENLKKSDYENIFRVYGSIIRYMKTDGITDKTKFAIKYRTYKCIKTIKNILLATFIISTVSISLYILLLLSAKYY